MPGRPQRSAERAAVPDGRWVEMTQFTLHAPPVAGALTGISYTTAFGDCPADLVGSIGPGKILEGVRDKAAVGGRLRSDNSLTVAGHPAREYDIAASRSFAQVTRSILIGNRLYQVSVASHVTQLEKPAARRFLGSFALTSR